MDIRGVGYSNHDGLLPPNDTTKYLTTDGEHLDYEGQQRYSSFLKKNIEEFL